MAWLASLIACCALAGTSEEARPAPAPAPAATADGDVPAEWRALASPYFAERSAAQQRLNHRDAAAARGLVPALLRQENAYYRRAGAEWLRVQFDRGSAEPADAEELAAALARERAPGVLERMVEAAAGSDDCIARLRAEVASGTLSPGVLDRVLDDRALLALERVMHDGRVPGFYDGQFQAVYAGDPDAYRRMLALAWDPRVNFVLRTLAVMALHEPRRPDLQNLLVPLLIDPLEEHRRQEELQLRRSQSDADIRYYIDARLSQYARFALAKAGIGGPIEQKIAVLKAGYRQFLELASQYPAEEEDGTANFYLERAMDTIFEVGYHYQQLDRYEEAERHYSEVIECGTPLLARKWAHYNLACIRAIQGNAEGAIAELRLAVQHGFRDLSWAARDGDLKLLRDDPRFLRLLAGLDDAGGG